MFLVAVVVFVAGGVVLAGCGSWVNDKPLPAPPPPREFGTKAEIGTHGDDPNPDALYHGAFPSNDETQERSIGGAPARFSGYTTWLRSVARVPASSYTSGYAGNYLRIDVTVFNRDTERQKVCACDFSVWTPQAGKREADAVKTHTLSADTSMRSGARLDGDVYLYVGNVPGPYFVIYDPDGRSTPGSQQARGVWRIPA